jgi:hypothetical protein
MRPESTGSLTRTGGWPGAPTFLPYAIDLVGNETL